MPQLQKGQKPGQPTAPAAPPPGMWEDLVRYGKIVGGGIADTAHQMMPTFPQRDPEDPTGRMYRQVDIFGRPVPERGYTSREQMTQPPAGFREYLAGLGGVAGDVLSQRGTLTSGPYSAVMTGTTPTRVYRGREARVPAAPEGIMREDPRFFNPQKKRHQQFPGIRTYNENPVIGDVHTYMGNEPVPSLKYNAAQIEEAARQAQTIRAQLAETRDPRVRAQLESQLIEAQRIERYAPNVSGHYLDITKPFDVQKDRIPINVLEGYLSRQEWGNYEVGLDPSVARLQQVIRDQQMGTGHATPPQSLSSAERRRGSRVRPPEPTDSVSWKTLREAIGMTRASEILQDLMEYNGLTTRYGIGETGRTRVWPSGQPRPTGQTWAIWDPRREYPGWITTEALADLERQRTLPIPREGRLREPIPLEQVTGGTGEYLPERTPIRTTPQAPQAPSGREALLERLRRLKLEQSGEAPP